MKEVQIKMFSSSSKIVSNPPIPRYWKELKRRSINKATALLIFYSIPAFCCLFSIKTVALSLIVPPESSNCLKIAQDPQLKGKYSRYVLRTLQTTLTFLAFPMMGWIAEVILGRTRTINISLYAMWLGMLLQTIGYTTQLMTCGTPFNAAKYGLIPLSMLLLILGTAGFFSNLPAYILEQMISEPSDKLRAAVHWMTWSLFIGLEIEFIVFPQTIQHSYGNEKSVVIGSIIIFSVLSVAIVLNEIFRERFSVIGTMKKNSIKLIWHVMLYARKQSTFQHRSAFSYWDKKMPSKLDLGKVKYGGPFSDEEVEDVKSFWRVSIVLCTMLGFYTSFSAISYDGMTYITMYEDNTHFLNGHILFALFYVIAIILIPVLEFILIPCIPKIDYWLQNLLKGMGASYILFLLCICLMTALDAVGQLRGHKVSCYLHSAQGDTKYNLSFLYYAGTLTLYNIADIFNFIFSVQFLMSQAPGTMCGLLTGLFWLLRALGANLAELIKLPFDLVHSDIKSCSFWILLIYLIICMISILFYIKVALWYQKRKKSDTFLGKEIVEEYYERLIDQGQGEQSYPPLLSRSINYFEYEAAIQNTNSIVQ